MEKLFDTVHMLKEEIIEIQQISFCLKFVTEVVNG
jgi:hypothetical protein